MKRFAIVAVAVVLVAASVSAADYFFPHFMVYKDSPAYPMPKDCAQRGGLLGPASGFVDDDGVTSLTYTCADGSVVIRTDLRPGSGTAVGASASAIQMKLDAPNGTAPRGSVIGGGWAFESGHAIESIHVYVNGQDVSVPVGRGERADVTAVYGAAAQGSGFTFELNTSQWQAGTYQVQAQAYDDQGRMNMSNALMLTVQ